MKSSEEQIPYEKNNTVEANITSKEKLLDIAFNFHAKGNITEAKKHYQLFIDKGYSDARVFLNFGIILQQIGQLKEAEISTRKAIQINPKYCNCSL